MYRLLILIFTFFNTAYSFAAEDPDELYRQGNFAEAEKAYQKKDIDNPKETRFRYNRGCAAFQNSDFDTAMASFSSVLRRTNDKEIEYKALYNLGNSAFKKGDFESAAEYYKQAIKLDPQKDDPKYNLELALREIDRLKKEKEQNKQEQEQQQKEDQQQGQDRDQGTNQDPSAKDQAQKDSGQEPEKGDRSEEKDQESKKEENSQDKDADSQTGQDNQKDLSGELSSTGEMGEQNEPAEQDQAGSSLDKNRAEAMLDNIKEDRSRFLQFQVPEDKRQGVGSGKNW